MGRTIEEKLFLIKLLKEGASLRRLSREHHVGMDSLLMWSRKYDRYGIDGLRPESHANKHIPKEIKEEILRQHFEESIPLQWLALKTRISASLMAKWVKDARAGGRWVDCMGRKGRKPSAAAGSQPVTSVEEKPYGGTRGKEPCRQTKYMGRKKKKGPKTELDLLKEENLRLRAENALLKKVQALVLEEEMPRNGQMPSTN